MKVCLNGRQEKEFLKKADEIKLEYRDRRIITDFVKDYPGANIIIELFGLDNNDIDWKMLQEYDLISNNKLYLCVTSFEQAELAIAHQIKFYCGYPLESEFELRGWINIGASYVRLGMPLFFDLPRLKETYGSMIQFRTVPNVAYLDNLPRVDGINGQWIRPEDMQLYANYIDVFEFESNSRKQEKALYHRYIELQEWPGSLKTIITNFHADGSNPMILSEIAQRRLSCRQKCASGGKCRICYRAVDLANPDKITAYVQSQIAQEELESLED